MWEGERGSISGQPDLSLSSFFLKSLKFKKQLLLPSLQPTACHVGWLEESPSLLFPLCRRAWLPGSSFSFTLVSPVSLSGPGGKEERWGWGEWGDRLCQVQSLPHSPQGHSLPFLTFLWSGHSWSQGQVLSTCPWTGRITSWLWAPSPVLLTPHKSGAESCPSHRVLGRSKSC